jgi:hypothetical protein
MWLLMNRMLRQTLVEDRQERYLRSVVLRPSKCWLEDLAGALSIADWLAGRAIWLAENVSCWSRDPIPADARVHDVILYGEQAMLEYEAEITFGVFS